MAGAAIALVSCVGALAALPPDARNEPSEHDFATRLDAARSQAGLDGLRVMDDLVAVARRHSEDMATQHRLAHNPDLSNEVTGWRSLGENVGTGSDVASVHDAFMQSQVHRDDILDPHFREVGVGVVWDGTTLWVTEVFREPTGASPTPRPSPAPAPAPAPRPQSAPATRALAPAAPAAPVAPPATAPAPAAASAPAPAPTTTVAAPAPAPTSVGAVVASAALDLRLGDTREQAIALAPNVPRVPLPVGVAAGLLSLVVGMQGVAVRRLGLA